MYMRSRSPAKIADSSPPVPARISRKMLRSSFGSFGSSSRCRSASSVSMRPPAAWISSSASAFMSGSDSISCAPASSAQARLYSWKRVTTGSISDRSRPIARKRFMSRAASSLASPRSISSSRRASCSSLLCMDGFIESFLFGIGRGGGRGCPAGARGASGQRPARPGLAARARAAANDRNWSRSGRAATAGGPVRFPRWPRAARSSGRAGTCWSAPVTGAR